MNIIVAPASPLPSLAANSIQAIKMSEALANLGHNVTLITKSNKQVLPAMKDVYGYYGVKNNFKLLKFVTLPGKIGVLMHGFAVSFAAYLLRANVIYTRCLIIAVIAVHMGHKVIFECHNADPLSSIKKNLFQNLVLHKNFNALVVISQALENLLNENFNIPREKIILAPSGAEVIEEKNETPPFKKIVGRPIIGHIGHLYKGRGTDLIIALARALPNIDFHIIGGAPKDIAFWKSEANDLKNLIFHDYISPARVPVFMLNCDILIAPYDKDRISTSGMDINIAEWISPLKIFNYMSSGKPIICSDLPVLREILEDNQTALLCPSNDVHAWTAAVQRLCDDPLLAKKIGQQAKEKFLARYTWDKRAELVIKKLPG